VPRQQPANPEADGSQVSGDSVDIASESACSSPVSAASGAGACVDLVDASGADDVCIRGSASGSASPSQVAGLQQNDTATSEGDSCSDADDCAVADESPRTSAAHSTDSSRGCITGDTTACTSPPDSEDPPDCLTEHSSADTADERSAAASERDTPHTPRSVRTPASRYCTPSPLSPPSHSKLWRSQSALHTPPPEVESEEDRARYLDLLPQLTENLAELKQRFTDALADAWRHRREQVWAEENRATEWSAYRTARANSDRTVARPEGPELFTLLEIYQQKRRRYLAGFWDRLSIRKMQRDAVSCRRTDSWTLTWDDSGFCARYRKRRCVTPRSESLQLKPRELLRHGRYVKTLMYNMFLSGTPPRSTVLASMTG
jgi:hypothetical protein